MKIILRQLGETRSLDEVCYRPINNRKQLLFFKESSSSRLLIDYPRSIQEEQRRWSWSCPRMLDITCNVSTYPEIIFFYFHWQVTAALTRKPWISCGHCGRAGIRKPDRISTLYASHNEKLVLSKKVREKESWSSSYGHRATLTEKSLRARKSSLYNNNFLRHLAGNISRRKFRGGFFGNHPRYRRFREKVLVTNDHDTWESSLHSRTLDEIHEIS